MAILDHLAQHHIAAVLDQFRTPQRVVQGAVLQHAHKHCGLLHVQRLGWLVEVHIRSAFHPDRLVDEVVSVQVQGHDFFLGVVPLQTGSDDPLLGFLQDGPLEETGGLVLVREQQLGQLLGHRRPAAAFPHEGDGAGESDEINA